MASLAAVAWFDRTLMRHWFPQWTPEVWRVLDEPGMVPVPATLSDLPLTVVDGSDAKAPLVVLLSGNLGWWAIDQGLTQGFRARGATTVGLNSLAYFVHHRTPEEVAQTLARVVSVMGPQRDLVLVGYSYGADILATCYDSLPAEVKARVKLVSLLAMSRSVRYGIGLGKWFAEQRETLSGVRKIIGPAVACVQGANEIKRSGCVFLDPKTVNIITIPGGHHFDGDYADLAGRVWMNLPAHP